MKRVKSKLSDEPKLTTHMYLLKIETLKSQNKRNSRFNSNKAKCKLIIITVEKSNLNNVYFILQISFYRSTVVTQSLKINQIIKVKFPTYFDCRGHERNLFECSHHKMPVNTGWYSKDECTQAEVRCKVMFQIRFCYQSYL